MDRALRLYAKSLGLPEAYARGLYLFMGNQADTEVALDIIVDPRIYNGGIAALSDWQREQPCKRSALLYRSVHTCGGLGMAVVSRQPSRFGHVAPTFGKTELALACFLCLPFIEAASLECLSAAMSAAAGPVEGLLRQLFLEAAVLSCLQTP